VVLGKKNIINKSIPAFKLDAPIC